MARLRRSTEEEKRGKHVVKVGGDDVIFRFRLPDFDGMCRIYQRVASAVRSSTADKREGVAHREHLLEFLDGIEGLEHEDGRPVEATREDIEWLIDEIPLHMLAVASSIINATPAGLDAEAQAAVVETPEEVREGNVDSSATSDGD